MDPVEQTEVAKTSEIEVDPRLIAVATTTFYPKWYSGEADAGRDLVGKVRGDLAIKTLREATQKGFQLLVVDGGSSEPFKAELAKMGIVTQSEIYRGMSPSRQQSFKEASQLEGVKVICWVEPEKISIVRDCLPDAVIPILEGKADIVIPNRVEESYKTYPDYQVVFEKKSNKLWNKILREHNLLPEDSPDLDVWFGPRFFKNDSEILSLFLKRYKFEKRNTKLDQVVDPDTWPNATFFPVVVALHRGFKVVSVDVSYRHPPEQTKIEADSDEFRRKRDIQYKGIIVATNHFIRMLEGDQRSRIKPV